MADVNDMELLRDYADRKSEPAFAELVQRHINLVYSVALRHVGNSPDAEDVTQAVFVILVKKATSLRLRLSLTGWLYETTRFTARQLLRTRARRAIREQEAYMQSITNDSNSQSVWRELAPILEEGMARLSEKERTLVALRFFENKSAAETAALLGIGEWAARKRVERAVEKLRLFFLKRGVAIPTAAMMTAISTNSVHAAPLALVKATTAVALTKSAATSTSTLTLVKGALKIMAWSKAKTVIIASAVVLLAVATPVTVREIQKHRTYAWQLPPFPKNPTAILWNTAPQVRIIPSLQDKFIYGLGEGGPSVGIKADGTTVSNYSPWQSIGIGETLDSIIQTAYDAQPLQVVYQTELPQTPLYDFISNLHNDTNATSQPLRDLIKKQFKIVAHWEPRETDVIVVQLADPGAPAFKPPGSLLESAGITITDDDEKMEYNNGRIEKDTTTKNRGITSNSRTFINISMAQLLTRISLESNFKLPIVNETGLMKRYDCTVTYPQWNRNWKNQSDAVKNAWKETLRQELGLQLVSDKRTVPMLIVEKAR